MSNVRGMTYGYPRDQVCYLGNFTVNFCDLLTCFWLMDIPKWKWVSKRPHYDGFDSYNFYTDCGQLIGFIRPSGDIVTMFLSWKKENLKFRNSFVVLRAWPSKRKWTITRSIIIPTKKRWKESPLLDNIFYQSIALQLCIPWLIRLVIKVIVSSAAEDAGNKDDRIPCQWQRLQLPLIQLVTWFDSVSAAAYWLGDDVLLLN